MNQLKHQMKQIKSFSAKKCSSQWRCDDYKYLQTQIITWCQHLQNKNNAGTRENSQKHTRLGKFIHSKSKTGQWRGGEEEWETLKALHESVPLQDACNDYYLTLMRGEKPKKNVKTLKWNVEKVKWKAVCRSYDYIPRTVSSGFYLINWQMTRNNRIH